MTSNNDVDIYFNGKGLKTINAKDLEWESDSYKKSKMKLLCNNIVDLYTKEKEVVKWKRNQS